ncbi:MAG: hypothetical protein J6X37_01215 [Treponema sp.]|nr:hypothetical protein [Treponema sp.]
MNNYCYFKSMGRYGAIPLVIDLYDDAAAGDSDAIDEMEDEFGDDWEGEY